MKFLEIEPLRGRLDARVDAPPSKSLTHRGLIVAALARGESTVVRPLEADDAAVTVACLRALGVSLTPVEEGWRVRGVAGRPEGGGSLEFRESGTTCRLMTAVAALGRRPSTLDGAPRLRERPLAELTAVLARLGAPTVDGRDALPLTIGGSRELRGGRVAVRSERSSQFVSALLTVGPWLESGLTVELDGAVVSRPYIDLTVATLRAFGGEVGWDGERRIDVAPVQTRGRRYAVEGDYSSASYALTLTALVGGRTRVAHLDPQSAQADARVLEWLEDLGCRVTRESDAVTVEGDGRIPAFEIDLTASPDLAPTVAAAALFAEGPCTLRGVAHLRFKESDRLALLAENLRALGRPATEHDDRLEVGALPAGAALHGATIRTASDHRLAMAFAIAGQRLRGIRIDDRTCVAKSHPGFWDELDRLRASARPDQN